MNETINIFFSVDDNYVKYLAVTIASLEKNASGNYNYVLHILNEGLSLFSRITLRKFEKDNFKIELCDMNGELESIVNDLPLRDYYSLATYYRLLIPVMFRDIHKGIYLDCDMVVNGDISELYNTDLEGNMIGAVKDSSVQSIKEFQEYVEYALDVPHEEYFNAGMLLMDLDMMRKEGFVRKTFNLLSSFSFEVAQDQDALNVICKRMTKLLPETWNTMPMGEKKESPAIIHFNLNFKPWKHDNIMYEEYFWAYAETADVKKAILNEKKRYPSFMEEKEKENFRRLVRLCKIQAYSEDNYYNTILRENYSYQVKWN